MFEETAHRVRAEAGASVDVLIVGAGLAGLNAAVELARSLPDDITILRDAVPSRPRLGILFLEYNKLLAAAVAQVVTD